MALRSHREGIVAGHATRLWINVVHDACGLGGRCAVGNGRYNVNVERTTSGISDVSKRAGLSEGTEQFEAYDSRQLRVHQNRVSKRRANFEHHPTVGPSSSRRSYSCFDRGTGEHPRRDTRVA